MGSGCTLGCPGRASRQQTGGLEQRVGDSLVTSTLQLPEHLTPEQTHSYLTHQLRPQVDNSLTPRTSHTWRRLHSPLWTQGAPAHTRLLEASGRETPGKGRGRQRLPEGRWGSWMEAEP